MLSLTIANISRLLKDKKLIAGILLVPFFIVVLTSVVSFGSNPKPSIAVTDYDDSAYSKELITALSKQYNVSLVSEAEARDNVKQNYTAAAVLIPPGFKVAQQVQVLQLVGRRTTGLQTAIDNFINNIEPPLPVESSATPKQNPFAVNFIINFIFYTVIFIVGEVNDLKRWRLLSRIFTTPNSSRAILGSLMLAMFAILFMQFLAIAAASTLTNFSFMSNFVGSLLLFGSYIFFVLSVGILIGRFVSNSNVVPVVVNIIIAPLGIISGTMIPREFTPAYITRLDFLTPQYWVFNGIEQLNTAGTAAILPNVAILLLMGLCCFTAGAFRFTDLVEH